MADSVTVTVTVNGPGVLTGSTPADPPAVAVPGTRVPGTPGTDHGSLPFTGLPVVELTVAAAALLVAGSRLIRHSRPRRTSSSGG